MIADRRLAREIESHFFGYAGERAEIEAREAEIAEACAQKMDETGVRGTKLSDPTGEKAARMEEELFELKGWTEVVKSTFRRFSGTPQAEFLAMVYTERQSAGRVCAQLYLDRSTYFRWREKVLDYALLKAAETGLIWV